MLLAKNYNSAFDPFTVDPFKALHFAILIHYSKFLTFGRSGAQDWAPERPNVKN